MDDGLDDLISKSMDLATSAIRTVVEQSERCEDELAEVRDMLSKALARSDELSVKDILVLMLKVQVAMITSMLVKMQHENIMAKQTSAHLDEMVDKMKKDLGSS